MRPVPNGLAQSGATEGGARDMLGGGTALNRDFEPLWRDDGGRGNSGWGRQLCAEHGLRLWELRARRGRESEAYVI